MSATSFLWEFVRKEDNNSNQQEQEVSDEEQYQTDTRYEQERFTDTYSENFRDDENKQIDSLMIMHVVKDIRITIIN
jgi:hypothetical protein